jgi:hypothetical protein
MRSRNVIITLLFVLALMVLTFIRVRYWEPKKKVTFNRNPSRIEYSQLALCLMDCYHISANDIAEIFKTGHVNASKTNLKEKPFPVFTIEGVARNKFSMLMVIIQSGNVAKIKSCCRSDETFICNCPVEEPRPISFYKKNN